MDGFDLVHAEVTSPRNGITRLGIHIDISNKDAIFRLGITGIAMDIDIDKEGNIQTSSYPILIVQPR